MSYWATITWLTPKVGELRLFRGNCVYGDPYDWCCVVRRTGEYDKKGREYAEMRLVRFWKMKYRRAWLRCLRHHNLTPCWERRKGEQIKGVAFER